MIDIRQETIFSLADAARLPFLPQRRRGKRPHVATLYRWAQRGIRGIRLETIRVGGTLCTSAEAIQRFFQQLSCENHEDRTLDSTSKYRQRIHDAEVKL